jgi:hypothetical protein
MTKKPNGSQMNMQQRENKNNSGNQGQFFVSGGKPDLQILNEDPKKPGCFIF